MSHRAANEYEEMVKSAHRGYETFHQLPEGSSPPACLENSSAGVLGWAKSMETIKASKCEPMGKRTTTCALSNCCMSTEPASGFGNKLTNALQPRLDLDLLTRAEAPGGDIDCRPSGQRVRTGIG